MSIKCLERLQGQSRGASNCGTPSVGIPAVVVKVVVEGGGGGGSSCLRPHIRQRTAFVLHIRIYDVKWLLEQEIACIKMGMDDESLLVYTVFVYPSYTYCESSLFWLLVYLNTSTFGSMQHQNWPSLSTEHRISSLEKTFFSNLHLFKFL